MIDENFTAGRDGTENFSSTIGNMAGVFGRGLLAGLAGTLVMTAVQMAEMKLRGREASTTPAKATEKILDIEPETQKDEEILSNLTHFSYGSAWGIVRAALAEYGLRGVEGSAIHCALVTGAAWALLPAMDLAPPVTKWKRRDIASELVMHGVYCAVTGLVYDAISKED